jgi:hypothetical protein
MSSFQLIDLDSDISFTFQFFPERIRTSDRANWTAQETTIGVKPLFYGNREPIQISVDELILDNTESNISLRADLEDLRYLVTEVEQKGTPPPLLAVWGENRVRCVLTDLSIEEEEFTQEGEPLRARIRLELLQLQDIGEATSVRVYEYNEDVEPG